MFSFWKKNKENELKIENLITSFDFYISVLSEEMGDFNLEFKIFLKNDFLLKIHDIEKLNVEFLKNNKKTIIPLLENIIKSLRFLNKSSLKKFVYLFSATEIESIKLILIKIYSL